MNHNDDLLRRPFTDDEQRVGEWIGNALAAGAVLILGLLALWSLTGCAPAGDDSGRMVYSHRDMLDTLERGKAVGRLRVYAGGSPLSAGTKWVVFLGAENSEISFEGEVDFSHHASWVGPTTQPSGPPP